MNLITLSIAGLMSLNQPNLLGYKEQDRASIEISAQGQYYEARIYSELSTDLYTINNSMQVGAKFEFFSVGIEDRKINRDSYGNSAQFIYLKYKKEWSF